MTPEPNGNEVWLNINGLKITYGFMGFLIIGAIVLLFCWFGFLSQWLGNTNIGSIFAKQTFSAQYWVYLQPDNASTKNYRVKADINRFEGDYSLSKVYWDNGGTSDFSDCNITGSVAKTSIDSCRPDGEEDTFYKIRMGEQVASNE